VTKGEITATASTEYDTRQALAYFGLEAWAKLYCGGN